MLVLQHPPSSGGSSIQGGSGQPCYWHRPASTFPVFHTHDTPSGTPQQKLIKMGWWIYTVMKTDDLLWGFPTSRCCPASSKSRGWFSSHPTGQDSLWLLRVCCCTCRLVQETSWELYLGINAVFNFTKLFKGCSQIIYLLMGWPLFQPLSWQQPYVPVLAGGMLDFLMAPTAFLMGCHISHFEEVAAVSTSVLLPLFEQQHIAVLYISLWIGLPSYVSPNTGKCE